MNSTQSNTITRILQKPGERAYQMLVRMYGVPAEIFAVKNLSKPHSPLHGFQDDHQDYEDTPYYTGKVLIPSLYRRRRATNLVALDPFIDSDTYLYLPTSIELRLHSLIRCTLGNGRIYNFRIIENAVVANDYGTILNRYAVVSVLSLDTEKDAQKIKEALQRELEAFERGQGYNSSIAKPEVSTDNSPYGHTPLE